MEAATEGLLMLAVRQVAVSKKHGKPPLLALDTFGVGSSSSAAVLVPLSGGVPSCVS